MVIGRLIGAIAVLGFLLLAIVIFSPQASVPLNDSLVPLWGVSFVMIFGSLALVFTLNALAPQLVEDAKLSSEGGAAKLIMPLILWGVCAFAFYIGIMIPVNSVVVAGQEFVNPTNVTFSATEGKDIYITITYSRATTSGSNMKITTVYPDGSQKELTEKIGEKRLSETGEKSGNRNITMKATQAGQYRLNIEKLDGLVIISRIQVAVQK